MSGRPFVSGEEARNRSAWEKAWIEKFQNQPWKELVAAWDDQEIFTSDKSLPRRTLEPLRDSLGASLDNWSVQKHPFGNEHLLRLNSNVEWAFGALDQKYVQVAKTLQDLPVRGQINILPNAGHRLITEASDFIATWIRHDQ